MSFMKRYAADGKSWLTVPSVTFCDCNDTNFIAYSALTSRFNATLFLK